MSDIFEMILVLVPVAGIIFLRFFINRGKVREEESAKKVKAPEKKVEKKVFIPETRAVSRIQGSGINKASDVSARNYRQTYDAQFDSASTLHEAGQRRGSQKKELGPERLRKMGELQRAVVMSEILGTPKALRHTQEGGR